VQLREIRVTTGAFDSAYGMDKEDSEAVMRDLLQVLVRTNRRYLRKHPECPRIYEADISYRRETTVEEFNSIPVILKAGGGDCDDLAPWRVAELIERDREPARIYITCAETQDGMGEAKRLYHIRLKRADGTIEDPSEVLGMHRALPDGWQPVDGVRDTEAASMATKLWRLQRQGVATAKAKVVELRKRARAGDTEARNLVHILAQIKRAETPR
jgi:hypothetical protein